MKSSSFLHRIDVKMGCFSFGVAKAVCSVAENSPIMRASQALMNHSLNGLIMSIGTTMFVFTAAWFV